ncbi:MAG: glycosyltransferase [Aigarchaeota archaeon]|nr:glycosyltransferase [Aigarchaeota archaeon]MDW8092702.1 glycosyltransferase [Nitrososphaerota archaeon]
MPLQEGKFDTDDCFITFRNEVEGPLVSVIIASRNGKVRSLDRLMAGDLIEVIVVRGRSPGMNRNIGAIVSKAEYLAFIDDDAVMDSHTLLKCLRHFSDGNVGVVGGPNLTMENSTLWERVSGYALASPLGSSTMRWRYSAMRGIVKTDERALTSCNLIIRRGVFFAAGGFPEKIYPAEENVLLHRISRLGYTLIYDSEFVAYHKRRGSLIGHIVQVFRYGRGRAMMLKVCPDAFKPIFVMPSIGLITICSTLTLASIGALSLLIPLTLLSTYLSATAFESIRTSIVNRDLRALPALMILMPLHHLAYALGFTRGLLSRKVDGRKGLG